MGGNRIQKTGIMVDFEFFYLNDEVSHNGEEVIFKYVVNLIEC